MEMFLCSAFYTRDLPSYLRAGVANNTVLHIQALRASLDVGNLPHIVSNPLS